MAIDIGSARAKPRRKKKGDPPDPPPGPPTWLDPAVFPQHAAALLHKNKISKRQFGRAAEQLTLFLLANCSAEFAITLQRQIRSGNKDGMAMFAKMVGLIKNDAGVVVNLNNNSLSLNGDVGPSERSIDGLVRTLDERDRRALEAPVPRELIAQPVDDDDEEDDAIDAEFVDQ